MGEVAPALAVVVTGPPVGAFPADGLRIRILHMFGTFRAQF